MECVAKWNRYQKTPRRQYRNRGLILTIERWNQNTPDIMKVAERSAELFQTHVSVLRNDC